MRSKCRAPVILNSALDGGQRSTSRSRRLTSGKRDPGWAHSRSGRSLSHAGNRTRSRSPANIRPAKSLFGPSFFFYFLTLSSDAALLSVILTVIMLSVHIIFFAGVQSPHLPHVCVRARACVRALRACAYVRACVCVCVCVCVMQWDGRCSCVGRLPFEI